jgi:hypothetical protein
MPSRTPTKPSSQEKKLAGDLLKIGGFLLILVVIYVVASAYFKSLATFTYKGLEFTKEKYGNLPVYRYYYYFKNTDGKVVQYNIYLLTDPRKNSVNLSGDPIEFSKKAVYVSLDDSYPMCPDNMAGALDLSTFLSDNQFTVIAGVTNRTLSRELDKQYVTCERKPDSEVIELRGSNETRIEIAGNCHRIYIGLDCAVRPAIDAFKIETVIQARQNQSTRSS